MALWDDLMEDMRSSQQNTFGIAVSWIPQGGTAVTPITGIVMRPTMPEDVFPNLSGSTYAIGDVAVDEGGGAVLTLRLISGPGVSAARLYIDFNDLSPAPQKGDTLQC